MDRESMKICLTPSILIELVSDLFIEEKTNGVKFIYLSAFSRLFKWKNMKKIWMDILKTNEI